MGNDPQDSASLEAEDPVTVSLGPIGSLFQQLRSATAWQYRRLKGVKTEIQILGEGLEGLCTDLKHLSETEDTITMCWVRQVRDLCYDTSDFLDELMHFIHYSSSTFRSTKRPFPHNRLGSKIFRVSRGPACNQFRLSLSKVKRLKRVPLIAKLSALVARVDDANERRRRFKLSPPQPSKHYHYTQPIGINHLMHKLPLQLHVNNLNKLLGFDHDERNLKVVTIFGSAGAGKTAVAKTLYHKYQGRFQYRAFLRVSRDADMRRVFTDLLSQIKAPPAHAFSDIQVLIATITKHLQGKSYLIVTDDLWDTSTWDIISRALPGGDNCRIIITTQVVDVALACCNDQLKHIYEITPLNDNQSGISEGGCTTYPSTEGMKEALNLVYDNLPPHLKTCLLYLNIYPEGWTVMKDELVKQWVAEGFIGSVHGQDTEETAGCYFDALVSTGMVQSVHTNHNDEVLSCTLHHMVLDLIRQKSIEENFVTIVNYFQTIIGLPDKVRRLSVQLGGAKGANNISENMRISQVRSLIFCGFLKSVPSIMEYGLLQVLILHIWSDQDTIFDLTTLGELYRLRYLKIECSITVKLPHKIQRLQQLGTLQVDARLYAIPSGIVHLEKLLHVRLPSDSILPPGVGHMTSLRTLGYFDLSYNSEDNVRDLGNLKNLKDLQLTCSAVQPTESLKKNVQLLLGSVLKKLSVLQSVTLVPAASCSANTLEDGAGASSMHISCDGSSNTFPAPAHLRRLELSRRCCILSRLPKWLGELAQLCIIKIAVVELSKEDISILNGLPALTSLSLNVVTMSTEKIVFGKEGFSFLRYFKFTCTATWLKFEAGAMPNLEKLKLCFNVPIRIIIIERLSGLKEISAIIGYAGVDAESALWKAIINDPSNPEVQLTGPNYYRDQGRGMVTREGSGEDGYNEADIRVHMQQESSRLPVPEIAARCRETEPEDRPFKSDIISTPRESKGTDVHAGQSKPKLGRSSLSIAESEQGMSFIEIPHVHKIQVPAWDWFQSVTFRDGDLLVNKEEGEATIIEPLDNHQLSIDDLEAVKVIGKGSSGNLQLVQHKWTGQLIALKVMQLNIQENIRKQVAQELKISLSTQSQYVVTCYQCFYVNGLICIAMEYMDGGSLADFLKYVRSIPEAYLAVICKQVLKGLMYLHHEKHIIHRDLKPSNILINNQGEIKISDFGVSAIIASSSAQRDTLTGTFNYMAPERISGQKHGYMSDIWSLGLVMLECATGNFPYPPSDSFYELLEAVVDQPPPSARSDQHSPEFCSFISACLQKNATDRSSAQILLAHPFMSMYDDLNIDLADYFTTVGSQLATFK